MKEFNLTEYLKNPSQKVVTRDGREVRIVCTDVKGEYPIMALIPNKQDELTYRYLINGKQLTYTDSPLDLCFPTTKKEGWINIYSKQGYRHPGKNIFNTKEEAIKNKSEIYIATVKINWEE